LVAEYGRSFSAKSLARMIEFAEVFPDEPIVATLSRQLSWSHFRELLPLKNFVQREYYAEICRIERWSPADRTYLPFSRRRAAVITLRQRADQEHLSGAAADDKTKAKTKSLKRVVRTKANDQPEMFP
jgi:hypothetical protein